jgi:hypothetical protein
MQNKRQSNDPGAQIVAFNQWFEVLYEEKYTINLSDFLSLWRGVWSHQDDHAILDLPGWA